MTDTHKSNHTTNTNPRWRRRTKLVRGGTERSGFGETSEAIFLTSGYCHPSAEIAEARFKNQEPGFIYSRYGNPTVAMFEARMAELEGAEAARALASGMAAVNAALMSQLRSGDRVVASRALFGSCRYIIDELLPRFGIVTTIVDGTDLAQWRQAIVPGTRCIFVETPANPTLEVLDIQAIADLAHAVGAKLLVDNVFATPILQSPLRFGADVVIYSATKHIDGQGRCLGGVVLSDHAFINDTLTPFLRHTGPSMSPFNAWVLLKGLETLELRVHQHCASAARIVEFLKGHPAVGRVAYPGLSDHPQRDLVLKQMQAGGPLIALEVAGGKAGAFRFMNALRLIDISNNLGDTKSLITHPATTTHQRFSPEERAHLGINDNLLRLSVGLEDEADIIEDIDAALAAR